MAQFGAQQAFNRTLPFSETDVLKESLPYLKKTLDLVDAEIHTVDEAAAKGFNKMIVESAEPGSPAFEYRNV